MSPLRTIAAGAALAAAALLALASPAAAHDEIISSSPAENEQLAEAPENITMVFSGQLLTLDDEMTGAIVLVVDESGEDWATGEVDVLGDTVTAELKPDMPVAGYQVRWQVVSEDGHTIAGVIPFTIGDAEPMKTESAGPEAAASAEPQNQNTAESGGALRIALIGGAGALVAIAIFVLYRFLGRRSPAAPSPGPDAPEEKL